MKYIKQIDEALTYGGGDVTKMPVIGSLVTRKMTFKTGDSEHVIPEDNYDVVEIVEDAGKKYYIINKWHKEHKRIPLVIHEDLVKEYFQKT